MTNKQQGKPKKTIPIEKIILLLAASFAAYNFGLAGGYIEHRPFSIGGLIAGIVVNVSIAVAASRFGSLKGNKRTRQAVIAFVAMLFISPVLVAPVIFYSLPDTFLETWWARALWSIGWPLVADLAIVLAGAVSGKGLIELSDNSAKSAEQGSQTASQATKATKQVRRAASQSSQVSQTARFYECTWPGCEWSTEQSAAVKKGGDPQAALAAHISHHNRKANKIMAENQRMQS